MLQRDRFSKHCITIAVICLFILLWMVKYVFADIETTGVSVYDPVSGATKVSILPTGVSPVAIFDATGSTGSTGQALTRSATGLLWNIDNTRGGVTFYGSDGSSVSGASNFALVLVSGTSTTVVADGKGGVTAYYGVSGVSTYFTTLNTPTMHTDLSGTTVTRLSIGTPDLVESVLFCIDSEAYPAIVRMQNNNGAIQYSAGSLHNYLSSWTAGANGNRDFGIGTYSVSSIFSINATSNNVGIGIEPSAVNPNCKLDTQGLGSFTSGVSLGGTPLSGLTQFVSFKSGTSPATSMTDGAIVYCKDGQLWVNGTAGDHTQITQHDPITGEPYHNSYNVYTGIGKRIYLESGKIEFYSVPKINPENIARDAWITEYKKTNYIDIEILDVEAWEPIVVESQDVYTEMVEEEYIADSETKTAKLVKIIKKEPIKTYKIRYQLKLGVRVDKKTGKFFMKQSPSQIQAETAADKDFRFNWLAMPKFVRQAWGKE